MFGRIRGPMKEIQYNPHHRISFLFKTTPHETRTEDVVCLITFCVVVVKSAYALRPKSLIYSVTFTFLSLIFFLTIRFFIISAWNWSRQLWSFDVLNHIIVPNYVSGYRSFFKGASSFTRYSEDTHEKMYCPVHLFKLDLTGWAENFAQLWKSIEQWCNAWQISSWYGSNT